jgi:hypothetical protein
VSVAAAVKLFRFETIVASSPKKSKFLFLEILKDRWETPIISIRPNKLRKPGKIETKMDR